MKISVLFVCLGNICRSPTADGIFRHRVKEAGLSGIVHVDSAGTSDYHVGDSPDSRTVEHAKRRGYDLSFLRARQVSSDDFKRFDYILAMDESNLGRLQRLRPRDYRGTLDLFLKFHPKAGTAGVPAEVPDPYYGGERGFETVLDLVEAACDGLMAHLRKEHAEVLGKAEAEAEGKVSAAGKKA